ncbi:MAG: TlpA family protein disulfide reductase [Myxococcales bacterium]|nr:TlpA family protein disulfide reductase [Myxococcales bacterium]
MASRIVGLCAVSVVLVACGGRVLGPKARSQVFPPDRQVTLAGATQDVPARGKVTVVDFWATTCVPCQALLPELEGLSRDLGPRGLVVVGVAADDNPGLVQGHVKKLGLTYPQIVDDSATLRGRSTSRGSPDPGARPWGRVRFVLTAGEGSSSRLRAAVEEALDEAP